MPSPTPHGYGWSGCRNIRDDKRPSVTHASSNWPEMLSASDIGNEAFITAGEAKVD